VSDTPASKDDHSFHEFKDAAIEAELASGHVEETREQAWHHVLVRLARMALGFVMLLAGLLMMVFPGPGIPVMAAALVILSRDVAWADRALRFLRRHAPGLDEEGPIPKSTIVVSVMLMVAAGLGAYWWFALDGQEWFFGLF